MHTDTNAYTDTSIVAQGFQFGEMDMTPEEERMALEAQVRALDILNDALKKKDWLLVEKGMEYKLGRESSPECPLLHAELVLDLIHKLQEAMLLKDGSQEQDNNIFTFYPDPTSIGLCQGFWERKQYLAKWSRPGALILAAAYRLGYTDSQWGADMWDKYSTGDLTATDICDAFEIWMNHEGIYQNSVYSCCGEKSRHSVCQRSQMSRYLLPYLEIDDEEELKKSAMAILIDSQKKNLLVGWEEEPEGLLTVPQFPIIKTSLVQCLMGKLRQVKFKLDNRPDSTQIAYTNPKLGNIIYLCPLFWKAPDDLSPGCRPGTIILHVAKLLGYKHLLDGGTKDDTLAAINVDMLKPLDNILEDKPKESEGLTADAICDAFEIWMRHRGEYKNGSYSCCAETARPSVCKNSVLRSCIEVIQEGRFS